MKSMPEAPNSTQALVLPSASMTRACQWYESLPKGAQPAQVPHCLSKSMSESGGGGFGLSKFPPNGTQPLVRPVWSIARARQ